MNRRVLVAGVGNVFLGDDGFGVELARQLSMTALPGSVSVADFGIRGLHLAFELLEPYDAVIVADAVSRGGSPGTLYVIDPEVDATQAANAADAHSIDLASVLAMARSLGAPSRPMTIVGCEPAQLDERIGLSAAVRGAIAPAIELVCELVDRELQAPQAHIDKEVMS